jgi:hypothetical protein
MEWGCYGRAGGVEESEFCPFLVVFPARCIPSISPRFYFRKQAFCFLPLVAILESPCFFLFLKEGQEGKVNLLGCEYQWERIGTGKGE